MAGSCAKKISILSLLFIIGCGHNPLLPEMKAAPGKTSAIAITLDLAVKIDLDFVSSRAFDPERVYFIKVDESQSIEQKNIFESNFQCESSNNKKYFLLLNATPGKYAAVAAFGSAKNYDAQTEKRNLTVFFPESMIVASIVEANAGTISHMGDFHLDTVSSMYDADKAQLFYYAQLTDGAEVRNFWKNLSTNDCYVAPTMNSFEKDKDVEIHQLGKLKNCFKNTPWEQLIANRLANIERLAD